MGRKLKLNDPTSSDLARMKASTPLQKQEDALTVEDIIKNDALMFRVHFMSEMMVESKNNQDIKTLYAARFGEEISNQKISVLKKYVRAVYMTEIARNRDEMVAEELMHANWELNQLKEYWEKSKLGKRKTSKHKANSVGTELTTYKLDETTENFEDTIGDLKAMELIGDVRSRVVKILGLEAPKQQPADNNKPNSITINIVDRPKSIEVQDVTANE